VFGAAEDDFALETDGGDHDEFHDEKAGTLRCFGDVLRDDCNAGCG
jgi:hypothetical protein